MTTNTRGYLAVALAAGAVFALGLGVRQSQALFIGPINSATGIGYAAISLAFAVGQMMWAVSMTAAGAMADRWGPRPVMLWVPCWLPPPPPLRRSRPPPPNW